MALNKKRLSGFSRIFMIGNKYAVSMDTCRVRDQFGNISGRICICSLFYFYTYIKYTWFEHWQGIVADIDVGMHVCNELEDVFEQKGWIVMNWLRFHFCVSLLRYLIFFDITTPHFPSLQTIDCLKIYEKFCQLFNQLMACSKFENVTYYRL